MDRHVIPHPLRRDRFRGRFCSTIDMGHEIVYSNTEFKIGHAVTCSTDIPQSDFTKGRDVFVLPKSRRTKCMERAIREQRRTPSRHPGRPSAKTRGPKRVEKLTTPPLTRNVDPGGGAK